MAEPRLPVCSLVARALLELLPPPEELPVEIHVSVPDVLLQRQPMRLRLSWEGRRFGEETFFMSTLFQDLKRCIGAIVGPKRIFFF